MSRRRRSRERYEAVAVVHRPGPHPGSRLATDDGRRCGKFEPDPFTRPTQHPQRPPHPGNKILVPPPLAGSEDDPRLNWPPPSLAGGILLYRGRHELKLQLGLQIRHPPTPQARRRYRSKRRRGGREPGGPYSTVAAPPPPCKRRQDTKPYSYRDLIYTARQRTTRSPPIRGQPGHRGRGRTVVSPAEAQVSLAASAVAERKREASRDSGVVRIIIK
ncbi:hypothetical protein C2845_PM09G04270 [Panicum miliaceum]|uniref:Uncharacterized protein n=1 Tax=Panicum miliaceum TaxID=4540 RepID=A0A3L6RZ11_PANMI|nr:hypothetical protein C2845_PM09G04270 [Panicum miliaceum]